MAGITPQLREWALKFFPPVQRKAVVGSILNHCTAYKLITSSITSSITLTAHNELGVFLQAGIPYEVRGTIFLDSMAAAGNILMDFNGGTITAFSRITGLATIYQANGTGTNTVLTSASTAIDGGTSNVNVMITFSLVVNPSVSGYFTPQFAQSALSVTATVLGINSYVFAAPLNTLY